MIKHKKSFLFDLLKKDVSIQNKEILNKTVVYFELKIRLKNFLAIA